MSASAQNITSVLKEHRQFPPPAEFVAGAHIKAADYERWTKQALDDPTASGPSRPSGSSPGSSRGTRCSTGRSRIAKWFVGGQINASYNCLDRHLDGAAQEQGRHHLGRRAGRHAHPHLSGPAPRGLQVRQRAQEARRQARAIASRSTCR